MNGRQGYMFAQFTGNIDRRRRGMELKEKIKMYATNLTSKSK